MYRLEIRIIRRLSDRVIEYGPVVKAAECATERDFLRVQSAFVLEILQHQDLSISYTMPNGKTHHLCHV